LNAVAQKIFTEIKASGAISFARFMELALYCPVYGYYETTPDTIGQGGNYYTNVSVGSLFGELLAFQFAEWLQKGPVGRDSRSTELQFCAPFIQDSRRDGTLGSAGTIEKRPAKGAGEIGAPSQELQLVEAGAHDGCLAKDILGWLRQHRPGLWRRLEYWIVEPSERRQEWQKRTLGRFANKLRWVKDLTEVAGFRHSPLDACHSAGIRGIIFSNELLDALPVRRLGWNATNRAWFEWGVTIKNGRFVWTRMPGIQCKAQSPKSDVGRSPATLQRCNALTLPSLDLPAELLAALPDGFTTEVCPAAEQWWRQAASALEWGKLLTLDYGLRAEEFFEPQRKEGTLRAYWRHRVIGNVLAHPAEQDITAHVNFTSLQSAGEVAGLRTDTLATQTQFLTEIAARSWNGVSSFQTWDPQRRRQFQTLTHPEHLGGSFRVLIQSRV